MRLFRLLAITVLLLACVVLGSACTGAQGEQGPQGETGATGATGLQGPQGIQGLQGLQGIQGIQGEKGDTGMPGIGVEWMGEWDSSVLYDKYDGVGYQGSSYISKQPNNTNNLPTDTNWWDLWVEKGETGSQGIQGVQGEKGDKGDTGDQGVQGIQGEPGADGQDGAPGPNMIVAMGNIAADATINQGYNIDTCTWSGTGKAYLISLTGITYDQYSYVTVVSPLAAGYYTATYGNSTPGDLGIMIRDSSGTAVQGSFSFMVLQVP